MLLNIIFITTNAFAPSLNPTVDDLPLHYRTFPEMAPLTRAMCTKRWRHLKMGNGIEDKPHCGSPSTTMGNFRGFNSWVQQWHKCHPQRTWVAQCLRYWTMGWKVPGWTTMPKLSLLGPWTRLLNLNCSDGWWNKNVSCFEWEMQADMIKKSKELRKNCTTINDNWLYTSVRKLR